MMASVGSMIVGSGRSSERTSRGPYRTVPRMVNLLYRLIALQAQSVRELDPSPRSRWSVRDRVHAAVELADPHDAVEVADVAIVEDEDARRGIVAELAQELDLSLDQARQVGDLLVDKGFLTSQQQGDSGDTIYKVYFANARPNIAVDL